MPFGDNLFMFGIAMWVQWVFSVDDIIMSMIMPWL